VIVADGFPVQTACRVLGVSESGWYARRGRAPSQRAIRHMWLTDLIRQIHAASRGTYGARRVHAELTMGYGVAVGHNAVGMLMSRAGLAGLPGNRRRRPKIPGAPTAPGLVDRQFTRTEPDELWVTDITGHPTREARPFIGSRPVENRGGVRGGRHKEFSQCIRNHFSLPRGKCRRFLGAVLVSRLGGNGRCWKMGIF